MGRLTTIVLSVGATLLGLAASAQPYTTDPSRLMPPMRDGAVPIIEPRGMGLYSTLSLPDVLEPVISIEHQGPLAYDVRFEFKNTSASPRPIGRLNVGILALGERIRMYDHAGTSAWNDLEQGSFQGTAWSYPGYAYSPVLVLMNQTHVVGVSLLYPVAEYRHDALVRLHRVGGVFGGPRESRGWMASFDLNNPSNAREFARVSYGAMVGPGESRSYTVAVRAMKRPDMSGPVTGVQEWLRVLEPYRAHFRSQFGGVTYERRVEPVSAWEMAGQYSLTSQNRRGFGGNENRPDRVGFAPVADRIARYESGARAVMIWAPSGVFDENLQMNFPSRFTAGWLDQEKLRTATDWNGLPAIARSGKELGLWWGRSAQHMDRWNDDESEHLDPSNPEHMSLVYQQLDLARQAGATMIGLDAFTHGRMPSWVQIEYLNHLRDRYPEMSFITEAMSSDLVHTVAPTFERAFHTSPRMTREEEFHRMAMPHYLADYLLPGHEIWGYFRYSEIARVPGQSVNAARVQRDAERLARNGYVPVLASGFPLSKPARVTADATWLTTVPGDSESANEEDPKSEDDGAGDKGDETQEDAPTPPPPAAEEPAEAKPERDPEPRKVRYITLPDGRRLRVVG